MSPILFKLEGRILRIPFQSFSLSKGAPKRLTIGGDGIVVGPGVVMVPGVVVVPGAVVQIGVVVLAEGSIAPMAVVRRK